MQQYELGFIGAGYMAEAIARAAISQGVLQPGQVIAADPHEARRSVFAELGIATGSDNAQVIRESRQVLLAVKPQMMTAAAADVAQHAADGQVIVSIMAGVTTKRLADVMIEHGGSAQPRIIRVMPNTPLQVGCGMAGVALGRYATSGDEDLAMRLFGAAGKVVRVDEAKLDALTAVSGSGPAYVFYLAEAMRRAADELGLGEHADVLVRQTVLGAAQLLSESDDTPAGLRRKVTSPGGTTEAAINHLDGQGVAQAIVDAVKVAAQRSVELGLQE